MNKIKDVLFNQLKNLFILEKDDEEIINFVLPIAVERTKESLKAFNNKYYNGNINPYNSVMYCNFLYWLARAVYDEKGACESADKVYYLNKALNAIDIYYEVELPRIWSCEHPVGSILGRASYSDGFFFSQGCTVGGNYNSGILYYPVIGKDVVMLSNSKIVGDSHIGNNVILSANSYVINRDIPDNSIVFGQGRDVVIKQKKDGYGLW